MKEFDEREQKTTREQKMKFLLDFCTIILTQPFTEYEWYAIISKKLEKVMETEDKYIIKAAKEALKGEYKVWFSNKKLESAIRCLTQVHMYSYLYPFLNYVDEECDNDYEKIRHYRKIWSFFKLFGYTADALFIEPRFGDDDDDNFKRKKFNEIANEAILDFENHFFGEDGYEEKYLFRKMHNIRLNIGGLDKIVEADPKKFDFNQEDLHKVKKFV